VSARVITGTPTWPSIDTTPDPRSDRQSSALLGWYEDWTSASDPGLEAASSLPAGANGAAQDSARQAAEGYDDQLRGLLGAIHQPSVSLVLTGEGARVLVPSDGLFDPGRSNLNASGEAAVDGLARAFVGFPALHLQVEGHTDCSQLVHTARSRWHLGFERAAAVVERLVARGVTRGRVMGLSFADTRPLASNCSEPGRARNRRIEILVLWTR